MEAISTYSAPSPIIYCQTPASNFGHGVSKWPQSRVTWHSQGGVGKVSAADFKAIIPYGLAKLTAICGLVFDYIANPKTANILYTEARLGTPGMGKQFGVLADSTLPPPGMQSNSQFQVLQRYDPAELWTSAEDMLNGKIPMLLVIAHESGHSCGLDHSPEQGDLMGPSMQNGVTEFGQWTRQQLVARYGPPKITPPKPVDPPTVPPTQPGDVWEVTANGCTFTTRGAIGIKKNGSSQRVSPLFPG